MQILVPTAIFKCKVGKNEFSKMKALHINKKNM